MVTVIGVKSPSSDEFTSVSDFINAGAAMRVTCLHA